MARMILVATFAALPLTSGAQAGAGGFGSGAR
jgi:hypothetical protein